jgi:hypothetical protein
VLKFNLQRVLSDPTGEQDRPLVVRRANMRKPAASLMMMGGQSGLQNTFAFHSAAGMQALGMSSNCAMSSGSNLATAMSGMSGSGALELQQPGSLQQLGLGAPQGPFLLQPMMAMQVCGLSQALLTLRCSQGILHMLVVLCRCMAYGVMCNMVSCGPPYVQHGMHRETPPPLQALAMS